MSAAGNLLPCSHQTRLARLPPSTRGVFRQVGRSAVKHWQIYFAMLARRCANYAGNRVVCTTSQFLSPVPLQVQKSSSRPYLKRQRQQHTCFKTQKCTCSSSVLTAAPQVEQVKQVPQSPWVDTKWTQYKWTVYRGVAYDLTSFIDRHPAGNWLINLAIRRDCTALFESYHLRPRVASEQLKRLPVLQDFPVDAIPSSPYPNDSDLYNTIR